MTQTATIDQLRPGSEYPDGNINARLHYTDAEIEELAASLKGPDGQLRPFLVATHPKKPKVCFVFGGGRRRIAFERLIERGDLPKDHPIEIKDHGHISVQEALSKSFADNQHVPMHPADLAQTFAKLAADKSPEDIARERGMTVRAVNQSIALGSALVPGVIALWREGKLTRENVETLTLATDEQQSELLSRIADGDFDPRTAYEWENVKKHWTAGKGAEMTRLLGFVGASEARAAGIEVTEDFFGKGGVVKDLRALHKIANAKMKTIIQAELDDGWSWAEGKTTVNRRMHHGYGECRVKPQFTDEEKQRIAVIDKRLKEIGDLDTWDNEGLEREESSLDTEKALIETAATARAYTTKQKASAGVLISLAEDGTVEYQRGLIRKAEEKPTKKKATASAQSYSQREPEPLSWQAKRALEEWYNEAAAMLLLRHPKEAFVAFIASVLTGTYDVPIRIDHILQYRERRGSSFDDRFAEVSKFSHDEIVPRIAAIACENVEISHQNGKRKPSASIIEGIIGQQEFADALAQKFQPKVYLTGASKKHMLGVVAEAFGADARKEAEAKGDEAVRKDLIASIKATGWLPPELRTKLYKAPVTPKGAVAAIKPKAKPAKKNPAPRKSTRRPA